MRATILFATALLQCPAFSQKVQCPGSFKAISAADYVKALNPGKLAELLNSMLRICSD